MYLHISLEASFQWRYVRFRQYGKDSWLRCVPGSLWIWLLVQHSLCSGPYIFVRPSKMPISHVQASAQGVSRFKFEWTWATPNLSWVWQIESSSFQEVGSLPPQLWDYHNAGFREFGLLKWHLKWLLKFEQSVLWSFYTVKFRVILILEHFHQLPLTTFVTFLYRAILTPVICKDGNQ